MEKTAEEIQAEKDAIERAKNEAQDTTKLANELAEARRLKEQAEMRTRQLENEAAARKKADEEVQQKQLEEQNEYKTLYERSEAERARLEKERTDADSQVAIKTAKSTLQSTYSAEVIELAEDAGLDLFDDSDDAKELYKQRLDKIATRIKAEPRKVQGNNIVVNNSQGDDTKLYETMRHAPRDVAKAATATLIGKLPAIAEMKRIAGIVE
jgi:hypothetical protein